MGATAGKTMRKVVGKKELRILMVGLDGVGKTTILYQLKGGEVVNTIPTIGFNVENVQYKNINFDVWDVGGQEKMRPLWQQYYRDAKGLIFVVDSTDSERLSDAKQELDQMLDGEALRDVPLLVFANKKDLTNSMPTAQISEWLGLDKCQKRKVLIQSACATNGDGITQGLDWLSHVLAGTTRERKE